MSTASTPSAQQSRYNYLSTRDSEISTHTRSSSFGTDVEPGDLEAGLWGSHDTLQDEIDDAEDELQEAEARESEWNDHQADLEEAHALDHEVANHYAKFYRAVNERNDGFELDQSKWDERQDEDDDTKVPEGQGQAEDNQDLEDQDDATGYSTPRNDQSDDDEPWRTASQPRTPDQLIDDLERYVATAGSGPLDQDYEDETTSHVVEPAEYGDREDEVEGENIDLVLPTIAYPTAFDAQSIPASSHHLHNRRFSDPEIPPHGTTASQSIGQHYTHRPHPHRRTSWSDFLPSTKSPPAGTAMTTAHSIHAIGLDPYGILGQGTQIPYHQATSRPEPIRTEQTVKSENGTFSLVWEENPGTDDADAALPDIDDYVETPSYIDPRNSEDIVQQISNPQSRNVSSIFGQLPAKTRLAAWSWIAEKTHEAEEEAGVGREEDPPGPPNTLRSGPSSAAHSVPHSPAIEKDFARLAAAGIEEQDVEDDDENADQDEDNERGEEVAENYEQDQDPDPLALSTSAFTDRQRSYSMPTTTHNFHLPTRPDSPYLPHPHSNLSAAEQENFGGHRDSFLLAKQKYQKRPIRRSTGPAASALSNELGRGRGFGSPPFFPSTASPGPPAGITRSSTWAEDSESDFRRGSAGSATGIEIPHQQRWNRWAGPVGAAGALERIEDASPPDKLRAKGWMSTDNIPEPAEGTYSEQEIQDDADEDNTPARVSGWKKAKYLRTEDGTITLKLLDDDASEG